MEAVSEAASRAGRGNQPLDRGEILENLRRSLRLKAPGDRDDDEHGECVCAPATDGGIPDGGATEGGSTDGGSTDGGKPDAAL